MGSEENPERKKERKKSCWLEDEERIQVDRKDMEDKYIERRERIEVTQNQS